MIVLFFIALACFFIGLEALIFWLQGPKLIHPRQLKEYGEKLERMPPSPPKYAYYFDKQMFVENKSPQKYYEIYIN